MLSSTTYGCHFIDQPFIPFIIFYTLYILFYTLYTLFYTLYRIDPPELPTYVRWWIQQTSSVGGRDFLPNFGAACEALFIHRTSPEAYNLLAVVPSFCHL